MTHYITKEGLKRLKKELEHLEKVKRQEIAQKLKEAANLGDISDNAQYQEAREEQGFLEGKILELKDIIRNALIIENSKKTDIAKVGSTVLIEIDGEKEKFKIVGSMEADPLGGKISNESPLGKIILGKSKGEIFEFKNLEGKKIKCKIIEIE